MAHVLVAVMPLDTQLPHTVQVLKHAGFKHVGFLVADPEFNPNQTSVADGPEVTATMQLLAPDASFSVKGLGQLTVAGAAGELANYKDHEAADFLKALLGHDADAATVDAVKTSLHDGHAMLTIEGDVAQAREMLKSHALFFYG